ncbi:MAG: glycosyltransferase family 39 protein [Elusimicrobiota bacterium]
MTKKDTLLVALIIFFGFLLRLSGIGFGLPSKNRALTTYNPDEALTFYTLEAMNPAKFDFNPRRAFLWGGFSVYLTGVTLKIAQVLGIVNPSSRQYLIENLKEADKLYIVARMIPVILGTASILIIFLIVKNIFGPLEGFLSAALLAITPAHIVNSFYVRPDVMMLFFALSGILFAYKRYYFLSGFLIGLAAATKLNAAVFAVIPLLLFLFDKSFSKKASVPVFILSCFAGFFVGCPYSIIDFKGFTTFLLQNVTLAKGSMSPGQYILFGPGIISYLTYYLPYSAGIPLLFAGIAGFIPSFFASKNDRLFAFSFIVIYLFASATSNQVVWYTIPVLPFLIIFASRLISIIASMERLKILSCTIFTIVFCYTAVYSIATLSLYTRKNTREEAADWIEKNIKAGSKIAIARSYFWTPPVLRQYNPPYKLIMGGDIQSTPDVYIPGLLPAAKKAEYVVLSEFEYRDYVHPKLRSHFPLQANVFDYVMNGKNFQEIASFDKEASFLGIKFKKNYPPGDWLLPSPKIIVYRKVKK